MEGEGNWKENVRAIDQSSPDYLPPAPERNQYLRRRDEDLEAFEDQLRRARDLIEEVIIGFGMYATPQHKNLPLLVSQQIEQVIEFRRNHQ